MVYIQADIIHCMEKHDMKYLSSQETKDVVDRVNTINFDDYSPENIDDMGEYKEHKNERKRLEAVIERADKPYLIYGAKGIGKTALIHSICRDNGVALIEYNCGMGTSRADLQGRTLVDDKGSYYEREFFPKCFEVANYFGHAVGYLDEVGALEEDIQKWCNRPLDSRKSCSAGGRTYRLNEGCKLVFILTTNPVEYAGVNNLTEDLKSRLIGSIWDYPSAEEVEKIIDWTGIPVDYVKEPLLTFAQNTYSLRKKGEVEYVLSPRDLIQFVDVYRDNTEDFGKQGRISDVLAETIKETILIKYTEDPQEQELIKGRAAETFGVTL